jgi:hypothetical protein
VFDNLSAVNAFYEWAQPRYAVANPVTRVLGRRRVELTDRAGVRNTVSLDALDPAVRCRIFTDTASGLTPAAVWVNEDGLPRLWALM